MRSAVHTVLCWLGFAIPLLFCACHGQQRQQMLALLDEADSLNRAYAQLPSDTLLLEAADFFDRHGSSNERLRAHYLLGCAYRDMGDAPRAIDCYLDAAAKADTTVANCDYSLLCRTYSQIAEVFYLQRLNTDFLESLEKSIYFGKIAGDSLAVLSCYMHKMLAYSDMNLSDSVMYICEHAYSWASMMGQSRLAAQNVLLAIPSYLSAGEYDKAAYFLSVYEKESGFFTSNGNVAMGREVYYYYKGLYYLSVNQPDSAELYFRKELADGKDMNNQNGGAHGLALLYQKIHKPDSSAKYALYSYEMNDSAYKEMVSDEVEQSKRLYNYNKFQKEALKEKERADREEQDRKRLLWIGSILSAVMLIVAQHWMNKRKREKEEFSRIAEKLNSTQLDFLQLKSQETELNQIIKEKEEEMKILLTEIEQYRQAYHNPLSGNSIINTDMYHEIHKKAQIGKLLTESEWADLNRFVIEKLPEFHIFISKRSYALNIKEYRMCLLLRFQIRAVEISNMFNLSPASVTKMSKNVLKSLFNKDGAVKELTAELCKI